MSIADRATLLPTKEDLMTRKAVIAIALFLPILGMLFGLAASPPVGLMPRNYGNFASGACFLLSGGLWATDWLVPKSKSDEV